MKRATYYLALLGTMAFVVAVGLTVLDIVLRSVSGLTVHGLTDIVTLCTMIGAMLAIPYGFAAQEHVAIDVFTARLGHSTQAILMIFAAFLAFCFLAGAAWFGAEQMMREYGYGDRSQSIGIPIIFYWLPLVAGLGLSALVNLWLILRKIRSLSRT
ncbi:TRAP transporter small permease [Thalassococcus profundi]|uniref:TRAP transporter small permease protein n=1 Tax=Thalassococcus profundi TaxID=2282382 RepID=A0A369TND8_9RHOB|nr:TRAP transporter small permease [Thalassococcus profundi]RDD65965.1 TRAP transporter small permease [Thalassococcus profundi]